MLVPTTVQLRAESIRTYCPPRSTRFSQAMAQAVLVLMDAPYSQPLVQAAAAQLLLEFVVEYAACELFRQFQPRVVRVVDRVVVPLMAIADCVVPAAALVEALCVPAVLLAPETALAVLQAMRTLPCWGIAELAHAWHAVLSSAPLLLLLVQWLETTGAPATVWQQVLGRTVQGFTPAFPNRLEHSQVLRLLATPCGRHGLQRQYAMLQAQWCGDTVVAVPAAPLPPAWVDIYGGPVATLPGNSLVWDDVDVLEPAPVPHRAGWRVWVRAWWHQPWWWSRTGARRELCCV